MARNKTISEAEGNPAATDSYEDKELYMDAEGKGAVLQTLEAPDKSKENKKTVAGAAGAEPEEGDLGGVKESIFAEMFDGEGLSESFKTKFQGIFEAELSRKATELEETLKAEYQEELETKIAEAVDGLSSKVDEYLNYVVENWMDDNKLAVETGMRLQIAESFIDNLKGLFENHYISIPDSKVNLLDEMFEKNESLKTDLDEALGINSELLTAVESHRKSEIASSISEGLTELDREKFYSLAEEVSYEDDNTFAEKLTGIKESYFKKTSVPSPIKEETHEPAQILTESNSSMSGYLKAIERANRFNNKG